MSFDLNTIQQLVTEQGVVWSMNIASALAVFILGKWMARRIVNLIEKVMIKSKMDETLVSFLGNVIFSMAFAFVIIAALSQLGVNTASLAAIFAAAGLAIGLSLQNSLSNLAAGIMIITFRPFTKGAFVELAGVAGSVESVSIFTTVLHSADNKRVIIPNGSIIAGNIINYSANKTRRLDLVFSVSYQDDLKKVKSVLTEVLAAEKRILKDPTPVVAVSELAESSVNLVCRPWVRTEDYWDVHFALTEAVKLRFDQEGISIPYPQQEVYMYHIQDGPKQPG